MMVDVNNETKPFKKKKNVKVVEGIPYYLA